MQNSALPCEIKTDIKQATKVEDIQEWQKANYFMEQRDFALL